MRPSPDPLAPSTVTKYAFIKSCQLILDGKIHMDIGGTNNSQLDAMNDFVRFLKVTGQFGTRNETCSIDYDLFCKNAYICAFELTSGGPGRSSTLSVPTVASNSTVRSITQFSEGIKYEVTQISFCIYNACFSVDDHQNVQTTFLHSSNN